MGPDPRSREGRIALAKTIMKLFDHWHLPAADRLALLGLSSSSYACLGRYEHGGPFANRPGIMERVKHLLEIHRALRVLFPKNRDLAYQWPTSSNEAFGGRSRVEHMKQHGLRGLTRVISYLHQEMNR